MDTLGKKNERGVRIASGKTELRICDLDLKPHSHCADVATVHPDAGQPVYRDAPGHIS